ncbi:MAG: hypothetical protein JXK07_12120 [Spirochaetes bacterium]|nr:hypothetical protein [Spirochaetota bacterium]MBN2770412.1 hypothetical protein [Spirochaetota bacterium]
MRISIIMFLLVFLLTNMSCSSILLNDKREHIKIIRVIGPIDIEVIMQGRRQIVSLHGLHFVHEEELYKKYIQSGKIDSKYEKEIKKQIKISSRYLSTIISSGDILYGLPPESKERSVRGRPLILFLPNLETVNEVMAREGHALPSSFITQSKSEADDFLLNINRAYQKSLIANKGLWRIGKYERNARKAENTSPVLWFIDSVL